MLIGGIHEGESLHSFLEACPSTNFYGFEIQPSPYAASKKKFEMYKNVQVLNLGFGEVEESGLTIGGPVGLEVAGIFSTQGSHWEYWGDQSETATVKPLSRWCDQNGIEKTAYVLIDVEGFEPKVLRGMELHRNSNQRRFSVFQYEMGGTWAERDPRHGNDWSPREAAQFLNDVGYDLFMIGKYNWMFVVPEFFQESISWWGSWPPDSNEGMGRTINGNILALHRKYSPDAVRDIVYSSANKAW